MKGLVRARAQRSERNPAAALRLRKPIALCRDFSSDVFGAAAVEFAFVGLLVILLILETMQAGFFFYTGAALDRATSRSVRQILTGSVASQSLTAGQFRTTILCPLLAQGMTCSNIVTNIQTVPEGTFPGGFYSYVNSSQTALLTPVMDNNKTTYCPGQNGSYVYVQVFYAMPVFSPIWLAIGSTNWNGGTVRFVSSTAAFRSEPFQLGSKYSLPC